MPDTRSKSNVRTSAVMPLAPRVFEPAIQSPAGRLPPHVIRVAHGLMQDIVSGRYKPGDWIREEEVAARFDCSRAPVREALRLIEIDGLIEMVPWRGARVVTLTLREIDDLYVLTGALMGVVARFAANHASEQELAEFEARVEAIETGQERGTSTGDELRLAFAAAAYLGGICGSQRAAWMFQRVGNLAFWQHRYVLPASLPWRRNQLTNWKQLAAALSARNGQKAEAVAQRLVNQSRTLAIKQMEAEAAAVQARVSVPRRGAADRVDFTVGEVAPHQGKSAAKSPSGRGRRGAG